MHVYRIAHKTHAMDLSGEGARLNGGRWNSIGKRLLYTSESFSLCICESLVHFKTITPPENMMKLTIELPDDGISSKYKKYNFKKNPASYNEGDRWIDSLESLAIIVPSVVVSEEFNILINPSHPGMKEVRILSSSDFGFDYRLFGE